MSNLEELSYETLLNNYENINNDDKNKFIYYFSQKYDLSLEESEIIIKTITKNPEIINIGLNIVVNNDILSKYISIEILQGNFYYFINYGFDDNESISIVVIDDNGDTIIEEEDGYYFEPLLDILPQTLKKSIVDIIIEQDVGEIKKILLNVKSFSNVHFDIRLNLENDYDHYVI